MSLAYYAAPLPAFLREPEDSILGQLSRNHRHDLEQEQKRAWIAQIRLLKAELAGSSAGSIYFELSIPRMGKRADCVLLIGGTIFVVEFKVGSHSFDRHAIDQVHDYALDLKNFHRGSHVAPIVPVLIATAAIAQPAAVTFAPDLFAAPICLGASGLVRMISAGGAGLAAPDIDPAAWEASGYQPTPTIIEAAQALY